MHNKSKYVPVIWGHWSAYKPFYIYLSEIVSNSFKIQRLTIWEYEVSKSLFNRLNCGDKPNILFEVYEVKQIFHQGSSGYLDFYRNLYM